MTLTQKRVFTALAIVAIPVLGYAVMHGLLHFFPMEDNNPAVYLAVTVLIIAIGLATPWWLLKTGLYEAQLNNPSEKPVDLADVPKDREQLARKLDATPPRSA